MKVERVDYLSLSAGDMLQALGDGAEKWAEAFCQRFTDVPQDQMVGWFASAIEHSSDVRRGRMIRSAEAWADFNEDVAWQRRFLRELVTQAGQSPEPAA